MTWLDDNAETMDMNFSKLQKVVEDRRAYHVAVYMTTKSRTQLTDWTPAAVVEDVVKGEMLFLLWVGDH